MQHVHTLTHTFRLKSLIYTFISSASQYRQYYVFVVFLKITFTYADIILLMTLSSRKYMTSRHFVHKNLKWMLTPTVCTFAQPYAHNYRVAL